MPGSTAEVHEAQAFVLRVVDSMQQAARSLGDYTLPEEASLASIFKDVFTGNWPELDPAFVASLRAKWTAAEMTELRRARGLLITSDMIEEVRIQREARQRADVAKHGRKECALPSCGKLESSVGQHKRCSACRSAWYCSAEHGALHWREHKPTCRATVAAKETSKDDTRD